MSWKDIIKRPLIKKYHKQYEKQLEKCCQSFAQYLEIQREKEASVQRKLTEVQRREIDKISSDILLLQWKDGVRESTAASVFARYFWENPSAVVGYCDEAPEYTEEVWQEPGVMPVFKPDWSPELFRERFYFSGLIGVRKSAVSGFNGELSGQDALRDIPKEELWKEIYNLVKMKGGFDKKKFGEAVVLHVPQILFWTRGAEVEDKDGTEVTKVSFDETGAVKGNREEMDVSVIIPSKDHPELVENCIRSLRNTVKALKLEIFVVDNGSSEENKAKLEVLAKELSFTYLYNPMPFHFSKMCNLGAEQARGKQVLFLNDDIECIQEGWLEDMFVVAERPHVGAVGSKLLYPDRKRIQHAGITNLPIGPVHKLQFLDDSEEYYDSYNRGIRNVLAVTGACLLMRRELFLECGGMSEELAVAFNDVELCFRLYELGYYQAVLQDKPLLHHESASRGDDESTEKWQRLMQERATLYSLHPQLEGVDPFYSIHLNHRGLNSRIQPDYREGKAEIENITHVIDGACLLDGAREDQCLLLRAEICRESIGDPRRIELYGYGVVLGSDNSLFEKKLLLRKVSSGQKEQDLVYRISFRPCYRADLEKNMPDQVKVALSGFWVSLDKTALPEGEYEVGMYAADRISRTRLYCFTSRRIRVEETDK